MRSSAPLRSRARRDPPCPSGERASEPSVSRRIFPEKSTAGIRPCRKKWTRARARAECPCSSEKAPGWGWFLVAVHNDPGERPPNAPPRRKDLPGEDLEKGTAQDRRNGKGPLRAVVAQARPLAAGHGEGGDPSRSQRRLAGRLRPRPGGGGAAVRGQALVGRGGGPLEEIGR